MVETIWSLFPPLLAIFMVLLTKRVLLSLGAGIVAAALFTASFNPEHTFLLIWGAFKAVFVEDGGLNTWNVYILLFVLLLGILTAFVSMMGGTKAFGDWMIRRVKTRAGAQIMTTVLGIVVFVDDYFNSLTVGQIAKPVTDKHRVSRAKLAYIVDSTSAPVCVIAPVSSWGAYIIGLIGTVLVTEKVAGVSAFGAFMQMIPMNFYVWAALGTIFIIAIRQADFGPMRVHEKRALETGQVLDPEKKEKVDVTTDMPSSRFGNIGDLVVPIAVLFAATLFFIYWTGVQAIGEGKAHTLMNIFGEADVSKSLLFGGLTGIIVTMLLFLRHAKKGELHGSHFVKGIINGSKSMLPAFAILIFAWAIVDLIDQLGTGVYLAELVKGANISYSLLPLIVFLMAGFIAFATGTSWGSFALLLPIAGKIAMVTEPDLLLPMLAAVLAGSVFGDHCSPISDTTIMSSTGSNCHHIDHVMTQLPYALVSALIAGIGYLALGLSDNTWVGLGVVIAGLVVLYFSLNKPLTVQAEKEDRIAK